MNNDNQEKNTNDDKNTNHDKNTNDEKNTSAKKINKGGKVLASGGFGCVFSPALKCSGSTHREKGKVSKLMTEKHAREEYQEINAIKAKLDSIKNYENYFLLYDATLCKPARIETSDLVNYTKKCSALPKSKITRLNINTSLDKVMILNMPNGGLAVDDYIYENGSYDKIYELHIKLVELFKKGIIPMNSKNIFHNDIKDSNVLVDQSTDGIKTRLIDWGLSTAYKPFEDEPFPKVWRNRPLQFNVPFSVIIFSDYFVEKYSKFIEDGGDYKDYDQLRPFVLNYVTSWMKERGAGHYKFINEIMYILYSKSLTSINDKLKPDVIETEFTMHYIVHYILIVLKNYTNFHKDGKLNLREYLDNVFIKNVDVWGFINVYFPVLELLYNHYDKLNSDEMELFEILKEIFTNYLYLNADRPINKDHLINDLNKFRDVIYKIRFGKRKTSETTSKGSKSSRNSNSSRKSSRIFATRDKASGITKRKTKKIVKNTQLGNSFKRRPKQKRFKNPIFLTIK
jgi:serine/threonine protein kinase